MNHPRKQCLKVREARANLLLEKAGLTSMNAAPSVMLTTRIALRRLCAETGCRVGLEALYCWIAAGKINSVRVGRRIYIPAEALDHLVENCLAGKRLYRKVDDQFSCLRKLENSSGISKRSADPSADWSAAFDDEEPRTPRMGIRATRFRLKSFPLSRE